MDDICPADLAQHILLTEAWELDRNCRGGPVFDKRVYPDSGASLLANSLCRGLERGRMPKSEGPVGNSPFQIQ